MPKPWNRKEPNSPDFVADESGAVIFYYLVIFLLMLGAGGMASDLMRQETLRAELQYGLDRGVLAAASLKQTVDPRTTVESYLRSASLLEAGSYTVDVKAVESTEYRRVEADVSLNVDTYFLNVLGVGSLPVSASSSATEGFTNIEVSLVLDISGTMRWNNRLVNLQPAARAFIDAIVAGDAAGTSTISLVPYAGQVNPGEVIFEYMKGQRTHGFSSCPEFTQADFLTDDFPSSETYEQVPQFHHWAIDEDWMDWGWCPSNNTAITYLSGDADGLKDKIDSIRLHDGTGTYNAMKWALALLDPSSREAVDTLIASGVVDERFAGRPAAYGDELTQKYIVLMTDGKITQQNRPTDVPEIDGDEDLDYSDLALLCNDEDDEVDSQVSEDDPLWCEEVLVGSYGHEQTLSRSTGLSYFYDLCDMAKDNGVVIFTIAFEAPNAAREEMRECATGPGYFYDVDGDGIDTAFTEIASTITRLKLTY